MSGATQQLDDTEPLAFPTHQSRFPSRIIPTRRRPTPGLSFVGLTGGLWNMAPPVVQMSLTRQSICTRRHRAQPGALNTPRRGQPQGAQRAESTSAANQLHRFRDVDRSGEGQLVFGGRMASGGCSDTEPHRVHRDARSRRCNCGSWPWHRSAYDVTSNLQSICGQQGLVCSCLIRSSIQRVSHHRCGRQPRRCQAACTRRYDYAH